MSWVLLVFYWFLGMFFLYKSPTFQIGSNRWLSPIFWSLKIIVGCLYGWIHLSYYGGGDTFAYFEIGKKLNSLFYEHPPLFFKLMFTPTGGFISPSDQSLVDGLVYWNSGGNFNMIRLNSLFHFFSAGNYWIHVLFFACLSFLGFFLSFRIIERFNSMHKTLLASLCFALPSLLFWSSGVHKDGLIFLGLVMIINGLLSLRAPQKAFALLSIMAGVFLVALFRNFVLVPVIPMIIFYFFSSYRGTLDLKKAGVFLLSFGLLGIWGLFLFSESIIQLLEVRKGIQAFQVGGAEIEPVLIGNSFSDLMTSIPHAFLNGFFQPFPGMGMSSYFLFLESLVLFFGMLITLFSLKKEALVLGLFLIFIALFNIVLIGWIVDNAGTIIRYRSVYLGFLWLLMIIRLGQPSQLASGAFAQKKK